MTKSKNTKRALLTSMLSMLLCVSMLIGSTYAWFTDSVTSGMNKIVAGNLDVELEYSTDMTEGSWKTVGTETDMFKEADDSIALWEPGYTKVVYLRVTNAGTLALKYKLGINVANKVIGETAEGNPIDLANYIEFGIVEGVTEAYANRDAAREAVKDSAVLLSHGFSSEEVKLAKEATKTLALVVYMPEEVGNEANYGTGKTKPTVDLGINLVATQDTVEADSFSTDYDADAKYPEVSTSTTAWHESVGGGSSGTEPATEYILYTAADLAGLAQLVNSGEDDFTGKTITLGSDIALDGVSNWIPIGTEEYPFKGTFDGAGHTVSGLFINSEVDTDCIAFIGYADAATIENLTVAGSIVVNREGVVSGSHTAGTCVSGVCAFADNGTKINRCVNKVDIKVQSFDSQLQIGGVVGAAGYKVKSEITNCINEGNITVDEDAVTEQTFVGGIVSYVYQSISKIENVLNVGNVPEMEVPTEPSGPNPVVTSGSITTLCIGVTPTHAYSTTGNVLYVSDTIVENTLDEKTTFTEDDFSGLFEGSNPNWEWNSEKGLPELSPLPID